MMETAVNAKAVRNLTEPAIAGVVAYVGYKSAKALYGWTEDLFDGIRDRTREQFNNLKKGESEYKNIFGLPGWGIWPGVI